MRNTVTGAIVALAVVLAMGAYFMHSNMNQANKNNAVDGCAKIATSMVKEDFVRPVYKLCMDDKGMKTVVTE